MLLERRLCAVCVCKKRQYLYVTMMVGAVLRSSVLLPQATDLWQCVVCQADLAGVNRTPGQSQPFSLVG